MTMINEELRKRLSRIKHVVLDMDGTIYMGDTLFECTKPFLRLLGELGIGFSFLTNNPSKSVDDYMKKLAAMDIDIDRRQMYTTSLAAIDFLHVNHPDFKRLFLLGTPSMIAEFEAAGFVSTADSAHDRPDAVVAAFDMSLTYSRLCRAAWWISEGLPYYATNPDRVCPTDQQTVLVDCGSICACLESAAGRKPDVVIGKPNADILRGVAYRWSVGMDEIAIVGDRLYTDVATAHNAGATGVLVLSGETTAAEAAAADPQPHITTRDLAGFGELLLSSRRNG